MQYPGEVIRKLRKEKKLTREQLAEMAGVPWPTIRDLERRKSFAHVKTLQKILSALGYDLEYNLVPLTASKNEKAV